LNSIPHFGDEAPQVELGRTELQHERRLAQLTLWAIYVHGRTENDTVTRARLVELGATQFEIEYIMLAIEWSNDMLDVCCAALGLAPPEPEPGLSTSHVDYHKNQWYPWFEKTVQALEVVK